MKRELLLPRTRAKLPPHPEQTSSQLLSARGMWLSAVNFDTVRAMSTRLPRSISCRWAMPRGALEDSYVSDQALVSGGAKVGGCLPPQSMPHMLKVKLCFHAEWRRALTPDACRAPPCRERKRVSSVCTPPGRGAGDHRASLAKTVVEGGETPLLRAPVSTVQRNLAAPAEAALDVTQLGKWDVVAVPTWSASPRWGG